MSRKTSQTTAPTDLVDISPAATARIEAVQDSLAVQAMEASANAKAVAVEMGYEGTLTVGALEDEIRFYQRRTVEAILETGKRLRVLQELTPRGEFDDRIELLGFTRRTAYRFMQVASKTAKSANLALLSTQVKNASAFLELVTHDDDALESLKDMDDIDRMSASELRSTLRQAKEDNKFLAEKRDKEQQRADKAEKALRSGGPQARSLEERVADFSATVNLQQDVAMDALLVMDQQIKALDTWYLEYAAQQPGYEPGDRVEMPVEVLALVQKLCSNVNRIAANVGSLQHLIGNTFGHELEAVTTYQMKTPALAPALEAGQAEGE